MLELASYYVRVEGYVVPKARPRTGANGHHYTPTTTREAEFRIAEAWRDAWGEEVVTGPLQLEVTAYLPRPKLHYRTAKGHEDELKPNHPYFPTGRPDWDNLAKTVCDALNGVAWKDDAQIARATVEKKYGRPGWEITVIPLPCCGEDLP